MQITQLEQSGAIFEIESGFRFAVDIGCYTPLEKATAIRTATPLDAMIVSHIHGDHFSPAHIKALTPKKLYLNKECLEALRSNEDFAQISKQSEIILVAADTTIELGSPETGGGIKIKLFNVDHGPNTKLRPKENFGMLIDDIYFAGDMYFPSGIDVSALEVSTALIPVGGFYTFDPAAALDFVRRFKKIEKVLPMHYEGVSEMRDVFLSMLSGGIKV